MLAPKDTLLRRGRDVKGKQGVTAAVNVPRMVSYYNSGLKKKIHAHS